MDTYILRDEKGHLVARFKQVTKEGFENLCSHVKLHHITKRALQGTWVDFGRISLYISIGSYFEKTDKDLEVK